MSVINRCDTCRHEGTPMNSGNEADAWLKLRLLDPTGFTYDHLDFCSWRCLSEYVTAKALIEGNDEHPHGGYA